MYCILVTGIPAAGKSTIANFIAEKLNIPMISKDGIKEILFDSGSACTYKNRMQNGVGIEMASVIPGFAQKYDIDDLVACIAPRHLLIVSSDDDKYSKDASYIVEKVSSIYMEYDKMSHLQHKRYQGGHALTEERFRDIIEWFDTRR